MVESMVAVRVRSVVPVANTSAWLLRRRRQVDLEFHGQHIGPGRSQRAGGVAVGRVGDAGDGPRVRLKLSRTRASYAGSFGITCCSCRFAPRLPAPVAGQAPPRSHARAGPGTMRKRGSAAGRDTDLSSANLLGFRSTDPNRKDEAFAFAASLRWR